MGGPTETLDAGEAAEATPDRLPQSEVLRKRDDIKSYFNLAYGNMCFDHEKAAGEAGFASREEADQYLSQLTGMNYGPDLKSGDLIVTPDGEEGEYFATAAEFLSVVEGLPDSIWKGNNLPIARANAYAERVGFPLDVRTMSARSIYAELEQYNVLEMSNGDTISTSSGRTYERDGENIYYNSNPDGNNLWGSLSGGSEYYVKRGSNFLHVVQENHFYDATRGESRTVYISDVDGKKTFFDENGNLDAALTRRENAE